MGRRSTRGGQTGRTCWREAGMTTSTFTEIEKYKNTSTFTEHENTKKEAETTTSTFTEIRKYKNERQR